MLINCLLSAISFGESVHGVLKDHALNIDVFVNWIVFVMPDLIRHPEHFGTTGFLLSPE
jgi:hypothetical protein